MQEIYIKFLESENGNGFTATVREDLFKKDAKGYIGHLQGTAEIFEGITEKFGNEVLEFLLKRGVKFVKPQFAKTSEIEYHAVEDNYGWAVCGECRNTVKFAPMDSDVSVCAGCETFWILTGKTAQREVK